VTLTFELELDSVKINQHIFVTGLESYCSDQGRLILFTGLEADEAILQRIEDTGHDRKYPCIFINMSKIYF